MANTKKPKHKKVNVELVKRENGSVPYALLDQCIEKWHPDLVEASVNVAIAWKKSLRADKDGKMVLGKAKKTSDLEREFKEYDAVVFLNSDTWDTLTEAQWLALIDHELCHLTVDKDENGKPKEDENGRPCVRLRRHDLEEFRDVVRRHGMYLDDIREFVMALKDAKSKPLLKIMEA